MGKPFYFCVSGLNKAPCSPESWLPVVGSYAGGFCCKMKCLNCTPSPPRAGGSCQPTGHSQSVCLSVQSTQHKPHVSLSLFHKCSCRDFWPHCSWKEAAGSGLVRNGNMLMSCSLRSFENQYFNSESPYLITTNFFLIF